MELILIDGGPASGKNTLGELMTKGFQAQGSRSILLDMDTYVEAINPSWIWNNDQQKAADLLNAGINYRTDINKYLKDNFVVIAIGERFLTRGDADTYINALDVKCPVYLYHLSVPFALREQRLHARGPHTLIDLAKDQKDRDAIMIWPGYVYENISTPEVDASNILNLIQNGTGQIANRQS